MGAPWLPKSDRGTRSPVLHFWHLGKTMFSTEPPPACNDSDSIYQAAAFDKPFNRGGCKFITKKSSPQPGLIIRKAETLSRLSSKAPEFTPIFHLSPSHPPHPLHLQRVLSPPERWHSPWPFPRLPTRLRIHLPLILHPPPGHI